MEFLGSLHPAVVHFPIAVFVLYVILENTGVWFSNESFSNSALMVLGIGVIAGLLALLTGNQAAETVSRLSAQDVTVPRELIERHELFASLSFWFYFGLFVMRLFFVMKKKFTLNIKRIFAVLAIAGVYLVYEAGKHGGELVYKYGAGTDLIK